MTPRVSVIVPVYNGAAYIGDTVASVLRQTDANFELLISDDGSTDDSLEIAGASHDPRIRLMPYAENTGSPMAAINRGIRMSRGDFIAILAADDLLTPESLARRVAAFRPSDVLVCGQCVTIPEEATLAEADEAARLGPDTRFTVGPDGTLRLSRPLRYFYGPTNMLRRAVFTEYGLFDGSLPGKQDREMWVRLFGEDRQRTDRGTFTCLPDVVGCFRVRHGYGYHLRQRTDQAEMFAAYRAAVAEAARPRCRAELVGQPTS